MSDTQKAILITVDGDFKVISWDDNDHTEHVREALSGIPALIPGTDEMGFGALFGRDPDIHPQGEVNPLATLLMQQMTGKRIYSFGDVVFATEDHEGEVRGGLPDFVLEHFTDGDTAALKRMRAMLDKNPQLAASIAKLEDIRDAEEKESVPE